MKAVIYARYSSDNQREESIEGQLRECTAYCKKNDITILRTYIDRAMSAKTDHRPDFQRMIKDSAKGLFDVIIVWKLDRFARNRYDSAHYKAQLRKYGVKVLSATENISDGPEGIILESMLEGMAEYYSAELSEKVIRGHTENALKCRYNGGTPTFGYIIDKDMQYQIDPRTAPAVLEMFTMYDKGATMKEIVARMSERGVTTVRGKKIDLNFVARLLKNRKYIGEYSYRHIVTPNGIPAIVPQDLFDRVQQRLAVNRKAPARHKAEDDYLLTTKLFCGTCGAMMVGESGTSSSKGRKYHYYRCVNTKKHHACDAKHKTVRKLPLENAVVNAVMAKIMDDNFVEYVADAVMDIQSRESSVLPALRKQMEEAESGITNMLNAIQMGIINASTKQRLDELEERKKDIELQIIQEEMKHPAVSREDVVYFVCRFRSLDTSKLDARRRLIDSFVNAVTIFDDYILITFNYKEGETRIDFADIESSDLQSVGGPVKSAVISVITALFLFFEYTLKYTLPILAFKYARLIYVHTAKITAPQRSAAGRFLSAVPVGLYLSLIEVKEAAIYPNASMVRGHVPGISLQILDRDPRHVDIRSVSVKMLTVLAGVFQRAVVGHRAVAAVDNEGNLLPLAVLLAGLIPDGLQIPGELLMDQHHVTAITAAKLFYLEMRSQVLVSISGQRVDLDIHAYSPFSLYSTRTSSARVTGFSRLLSVSSPLALPHASTGSSGLVGAVEGFAAFCSQNSSSVGTFRELVTLPLGKMPCVEPPPSSMRASSTPKPSSLF